MKNLKFLLPFFAVILFVSCSETHFEQPQPAGKKEVLKIPKKYLGTYRYRDSTMNISDDTPYSKLFSAETGLPVLEVNKVLIVSPYMVKQGYDGKFLFNAAQTKVADRLGWNADTIVNMFSIKKEFLKSVRKNGTLGFYYNAMDTMISISRGDVIKKYKGHLYLNKFDGDNKWVVYRIKKQGNKMLFESVNSFDKTLLDSICPKTDGKNYNPTKQQFNLFLKKGGFQEEEIYLKK